MKFKFSVFHYLYTIVVLSILVLATIVGFILNGEVLREIKNPQQSSNYESGISRRSPPRTISSANGEFLDYDYIFIDPTYKIQNESARKILLDLNCVYAVVKVYQPTPPIKSFKVDNPDAPKEDQTSSLVVTPGIPNEVEKPAYVCQNSVLKFESFSKYFNSGHYLYSLMDMYKKGNAVLLPVFDSLDSIRFHSGDREIKKDITKTSELYYSEALKLSLDMASATPPARGFKLWGRWAEAVTEKTIVVKQDNQQIEKKVKNFAINRWLNIFSDYFLTTRGIGCNEVWGSFDATNYYWKTVLAHEIYHHYFSPAIRDRSNSNNLPIDYSFYTVKKSSVGSGYSSKKTTSTMVPSLYNRMAAYFSEIKRDFWDQDPLKKYPSNIDLSNTISGIPITYSVTPSRLSYLYEPEEALVRLFSLMTFYQKDLDPRLLEIAFSSGYDVCAPSFFMQDYMAFNNKQYSINPFTPENFSKALAMILEAIQFGKPISNITKMPKNQEGISFQGWSRPNIYQKLVLEEINPLAGVNATKRNILDLSWSASNFYVRDKFNSPKKKYVSCTNDYDKATLLDEWTGSCQMWTTPIIDPNELFDKFFTKTTEVNSNVSPINGNVYVGFKIYFWNDLNNDGKIQENEKQYPNYKYQDTINARQMEQDPGAICKISIVKDQGSTELWRYVGQQYKDQLQNVDPLCKESWT